MASDSAWNHPFHFFSCFDLNFVHVLVSLCGLVNIVSLDWVRLLPWSNCFMKLLFAPFAATFPDDTDFLQSYPCELAEVEAYFICLYVYMYNPCYLTKCWLIILYSAVFFFFPQEIRTLETMEIPVQIILQRCSRLFDILHIILPERFPIPIKTCLNNLSILADFSFIYTSCRNSWRMILESL